MEKDVTTSTTSRTVITGVAGMLVVALGCVSLGSVGAAAQTQAAMPPTQAATVADAVSTAEAAHAAAVAAEQARIALVDSQRQAVADVARAQAGDRYVRGGAGPNAFDCSGLVKYAYAQAAGVSLPHNTRAQWNAIGDTFYAGEREPLPGDVVFFFNNGADHVGIYLGGGMMANAENPRSGVKIAPVFDGYWAGKLTGFGRVIH